MDRNFDAILTELGIDAADEATIRFIQQIIASRPGTELNPLFVANLRKQLIERARTGQLAKASSTNSFLSLFMKRTLISFAVVVLIVLVAGGYYLSRQGALPGASGTAQQILSAKFAISDAPANAFGSLATLTSASGQGGGPGIGGDSSKMAAPNGPTSSPEVAVGSGGTSDSLIAPPYISEVYKFTYEGAALENLPIEQPVFRRAKENPSTGIIDRIIKTLSLGLIDLTKFDNAKLQQFSVVEDQEFGYNINVDVANGYVNVYQNWEKWPHPADSCRDEACFRQFQMKPADIPADEEVIAIAAQFVQDKGISLDGYGSPIVQNFWRQQYELLSVAERATFYVPEVIDVIYPLNLDGKVVYDEGGYESGMHISVDLRNKRAYSAYELMTKQFQKSDYTGESDSARILKIAEQGGFRSYLPDNQNIQPDAKVVNFQLDTPTTVVLRMWKYDGTKSEELYVPALVFPIKNPSQSYWRKNVIVPLVKEVLDSEPQQGPIAFPVDLPLPAATEPKRAE
jgi:hypothetical protein